MTKRKKIMIIAVAIALVLITVATVLTVVLVNQNERQHYWEYEYLEEENKTLFFLDGKYSGVSFNGKLELLYNHELALNGDQFIASSSTTGSANNATFTLYYGNTKGIIEVANDVNKAALAHTLETVYFTKGENNNLWSFNAKNKEIKLVSSENVTSCMLSPNGKDMLISYTDGDKTNTAHLHDGKTELIAENSYPAAISNNGKYIYYAINENNSRYLYMKVKNEAPVKLSNEPVLNYTFTKDFKQIVFSTQTQKTIDNKTTYSYKTYYYSKKTGIKTVSDNLALSYGEPGFTISSSFNMDEYYRHDYNYASTTYQKRLGFMHCLSNINRFFPALFSSVNYDNGVSTNTYYINKKYEATPILKDASFAVATNDNYFCYVKESKEDSTEAYFGYVYKHSLYLTSKDGKKLPVKLHDDIKEAKFLNNKDNVMYLTKDGYLMEYKNGTHTIIATNVDYFTLSSDKKSYAYTVKSSSDEDEMTLFFAKVGKDAKRVANEVEHFYLSEDGKELGCYTEDELLILSTKNDFEITARFSR